MSKRFGKVRQTSKPNLEPPEPSVCLQKPNLEPTEPQKTEPNLEPNQVRPNTSLFTKYIFGPSFLPVQDTDMLGLSTRLS